MKHDMDKYRGLLWTWVPYWLGLAAGHSLHWIPQTLLVFSTALLAFIVNERVQVLLDTERKWKRDRDIAIARQMGVR